MEAISAEIARLDAISADEIGRAMGEFQQMAVARGEPGVQQAGHDGHIGGARRGAPYNAHPARVFMGDTGALALGSSLAIVALMTGQWLLLPIIGVIFVVEAGSNILQIGYYKLSGGKRIFRRAPFHHHLELIGWAETQIVTRFWLISIVAAMAGVALALEVPE